MTADFEEWYTLESVRCFIFFFTLIDILTDRAIPRYPPCNVSPLAEIPGSIELLENSLTFEGV